MAFECSPFLNHDCSGSASQATPERRGSANAISGRVGIELATYSIQFYVFASMA